MPNLVSVPIAITALGDNIVIQGNQTTPTIQVIGLFFQCASTITVTIKCGQNAQTGKMSFIASSGSIVLAPNTQGPYFQCNNGDSFIINLLGAPLNPLSPLCIPGTLIPADLIGGQVTYYQF